MGDVIKTAIKEVLTDWFFYKYYNNRALENVILQGFLRTPSNFGVSSVPVHTVKIIALSSTKKVTLKDFLETSVVLTRRYNGSKIIVKTSKLFREWGGVGQELYRVTFRGVNYYIGPGMLLTQDLKPLIMATCSVATFRKKGVVQWYTHSPTVNIAPELMSDPTWKKLIINYFIPLCNQAIQAKKFSASVPDVYKNAQQTINLQIHDLSQFIIPVKVPELTEDLTEELTTEMQNLTELPLLV